MFASLADIQTAYNDGHKVYWKTPDYVVVRDMFGEWHIVYRPHSRNPNSVGLFWADGVTSDYKPEDFYVEA